MSVLVLVPRPHSRPHPFSPRDNTITCNCVPQDTRYVNSHLSPCPHPRPPPPPLDRATCTGNCAPG